MYCWFTFILFYTWDKKGDEVIVSSQTHVTTAHAIELVGATPIFIDSNTEDGNIDVKKLKKNN